MLRVNLILLLCLGVRFALPLLSHNVFEHDPWHGHVVLGASSAAERARALAVHQHGDGQSHSHLPAQPEPESGHFGEALQVIPVAGSFDWLSSLFWIGDAILLLSFSMLPALIFQVMRLALPPIFIPGDFAHLPPIPPPRMTIKYLPTILSRLNHCL